MDKKPIAYLSILAMRRGPKGKKMKRMNIGTKMYVIFKKQNKNGMNEWMNERINENSKIYG